MLSPVVRRSLFTKFTTRRGGACSFTDQQLVGSTMWAGGGGDAWTTASLGCRLNALSRWTD